MAFEGSTSKEGFETYIGYFPAPVLRPDQAVVTETTLAHKGAE
jgi:hypothetical protein